MKHLRIIFVEKNFLQDKEMRDHFKEFFDIWEFKA